MVVSSQAGKRQVHHEELLVPACSQTLSCSCISVGSTFNRRLVSLIIKIGFVIFCFDSSDYEYIAPKRLQEFL